MITEHLTRAIEVLDRKNKTLEGSIVADQRVLEKQVLMADCLRMLLVDVSADADHADALDLLMAGLKTAGVM